MVAYCDRMRPCLVLMDGMGWVVAINAKHGFCSIDRTYLLFLHFRGLACDGGMRR